MPASPRPVLLLAVFIAGACSIVYELLVSTVSAYFLGDSVKQFSLTIGVYLFAMGIGALLTRRIRTDELEWFVAAELLLGLTGGLSVPFLYLLFQYQGGLGYQLPMLGLVFGIGTLTGLEIPLLTRALDGLAAATDNLAEVLGYDYIGALVATLLFPFLLLPFVGLYNSSLLFGAVNLCLGGLILWFFRGQLGARSQVRRGWLFGALAGGLLLFSYLVWQSDPFLRAYEARIYPNPIIYQTNSPYQNITLTQHADDTRLYLNRVIQFSSRDEYRYHEALALIPAAAVQTGHGVRRALILGGGEALLARELLKLPELERVRIVDLDGSVLRLARENGRLRGTNAGAADDSRVELIENDASVFLRDDTTAYDLILADLPDPGNESLARLYSTWFYRLVRARLAPGGVFCTQATSPFDTRNTYWSIHETLRAAGFPDVVPYHVYVPSFGDWGFHLACPDGCPPLDYRRDVPAERLRYLEPDLLPLLTYFPADMRRPDGIEANGLDRPVLLDYFLDEYASWRAQSPPPYE